jgi:hypothetical protein
MTYDEDLYNEELMKSAYENSCGKGSPRFVDFVDIDEHNWLNKNNTDESKSIQNLISQDIKETNMELALQNKKLNRKPPLLIHKKTQVKNQIFE